MTKIVTSNNSVATPLFESMTREELAAVAKAMGVKVGKSKANTISNLLAGVTKHQVQVKMVCTLSFKPADGSATRKNFLGKTLRTYVSGPGLGNQVWLTPEQPVVGWPTDPTDS